MGEINLGVGLYSCKTGSYDRGVVYLNSNPDKGIKTIIDDLDNQLKKLNSFIVKSQIPKFGVHGIFICPEYLFAAGDGDTQKRGVRDYIKERIVDKLKLLSKKYDGIIIIPGSIAWETSVLGSDSASLTSGKRLNMKDIPKPIPIMTAKKQWQNNDVSGQDRVGDLSDEGLEKIKKFEKSKKSGKLKKVSIQQNTIIVFHNGKVMGEYNKASDYKESHYEHTYHVSYPYPGLFKIKTHKGFMTMGLEVCLDHDCRVLNEWISSNITNKKPHLHIVCSACVEPAYNAAIDDGWYLHASSAPPYTCIVKKTTFQKQLSNFGLLLEKIKVGSIS